MRRRSLRRRKLQKTYSLLLKDIVWGPLKDIVWLLLKDIVERPIKDIVWGPFIDMLLNGNRYNPLLLIILSNS
jgi:hypothetical protein